MTDATTAPPAHDNSIIETLQSLIVAFVLAMTFRGFVTEGFVIPTGSMAPTLLGRHKQLYSEQSGWEFEVGYDQRLRSVDLGRVPDPMLGAVYPGSGTTKSAARTRMGDRILVLKGLYRFFEPRRYDVVVFKNPTNPNGEDGNYIKRLIGLPDEAIWLVDGDVFAAPAGSAADAEAFEIQRKPEYVQRAVWQPVYRSDAYPREPEALAVSWRGSPWQGGSEWLVAGWQDDTGRRHATFYCETPEPTVLEWDEHMRSIDDWAPYNSLVPRRTSRAAVNDLRVAAAVVPEADGLRMVFRLGIRSQEMEYVIGDGEAMLRMRSDAWAGHPDEGWTTVGPIEIDPLRTGRPTDVEFWQVDQAMALYINGKRVLELAYDWSPPERLMNSTGRTEDVATLASIMPSGGPMMAWEFEGSATTLHRMRVDRDLYYRQDRLNEPALKNPTNPGFEELVRVGGFGFGTHPDSIGILGPDHFFMAGDNSTASSDSRLWGNPHPVVATQIDESPFVVDRKLLLGKAWVVYFPAPHSLSANGRAFIPDFGRLRFIR